MTFWSNPQQFAEPLKQNRWLLRIQLNSNKTLNVESIKECSKPSYELSVQEHKLLNNTYKYPGIMKWKPINIKFLCVKPEDKIWTQKMVHEQSFSKYTDFSSFDNLSKQDIILKSAMLQQLNENGSPVETWELKNVFFSSVEYGSLSYGNEDFVEVSATIQYDWAVLTIDDEVKNIDLAISSENTASADSKDIKAIQVTLNGVNIKIEDDVIDGQIPDLIRIPKQIPSINTSKAATTTYADLSTDEFKKLTANTKPVAYGVIGSNLQNRINDERTGQGVSKDVEKITISNREAAAQEQAQKTIIRVSKKEDNTELQPPPQPSDIPLDNPTGQNYPVPPFGTPEEEQTNFGVLPPETQEEKAAADKLVDPN